MDKNTIKTYLRETFLSEEATPGISITNKAKKASAKINKDGVSGIEKDVKTYDKNLKQKDKDISSMSPNKFEYTDGFEKTFHNEMEILNGQEMLQYDSKSSPEFEKKAKEGIEGSSRMGNENKVGNAEETWKASSDDFGKNLVKRIKSSTKKRSKETPTLNLRGRDIQADVKDTGHRPYAIEENKINEIEKGKFTEWCKSNGFEGPSEACAKKAMASNSTSAHKMSTFYMNTIKPHGKTTKDIEENNKPQIKESMKRLRFKSEFKGLGNALKLIPEGYKVDKKEFEMTDGNATYKIRWEGNLSEGKAVVLTAADKKMVNEDIVRMKELFGYKSEATLGLVKGNARIDENKVFNDIWNKSKKLLGESEDIENEKAAEGDLDDAVSSAPEAKKHIEGTTSTDKGTKAPKAKEGDLNKAVSQAPEAKKHVEGSTSTDKGTKTPKPKEGHFDKISMPQAPEAKKHIHLKEEETDEDLIDEEDEEMNTPVMKTPIVKEEEGDDNTEDTDDTEGEETDSDNWNKPSEDDNMDDEKEPTSTDIKKEVPPVASDDDEDPIKVPTPSKGSYRLEFSKSTGQYWIDHNGIKTKVPDALLPIANDKSKKGYERASLIATKMEDLEDETPNMDSEEGME